MNNNSTNYQSILAPYLKAFVNEQIVLGKKAEDIKWDLHCFDQYLSSIHYDKKFIIESVYNVWLSTIQHQKTSTIYQKVSVVSRFMKYMTNIGQECYIPRLPRRHDSGFVPYIYSLAEINSIFAACDRLRMKEHHADSVLITLPTLFRLLYSTGIRISEALAIKNKDLDFKHHFITLNQTKNGSQRLAPINASMEAVLNQYIEYRNRIPVEGIMNPDNCLLVSSLGKPCTRRVINKWFIRILEESHIPYKGGHLGPRIHDIRHTTAVHALVDMTRKGKDLYCCLPILSTFLGHRKVMDTEHYLRITKEIYPELIKQDLIITEPISQVIFHSLATFQDGNI